MQRTAALLATLLIAPFATALAETCVCSVDGGSVDVKNFPEIQNVAIPKSLGPLDVRLADLSVSRVFTVELATGEKRALGPVSLEGHRRATVQVTQVYPRVSQAPVLSGRWFVRFNDDDPFFDPCLREPRPAACALMPPEGLKLLPLALAFPDTLDGHPITKGTTTIATIELVGSEGLLIVENASAGPRQVRVQVILDR